jgi:hypothetical protein
MEAYSQCPHPKDCLKVCSCLDELNAPLINTRQAPRLMTPRQANNCMAAMHEGKTLRRLTNAGKLGPAIVSLKKLKYHFTLYPEWADDAKRLAAVNRKAADKLKGEGPRNLTHCKHGHPLSEARIRHYKGWTVRDCIRCEATRRSQGGIMKPEALVIRLRPCLHRRAVRPR